jgi:hypothetical protein
MLEAISSERKEKDSEEAKKESAANFWGSMKNQRETLFSSNLT